MFLDLFSAIIDNDRIQEGIKLEEVLTKAEIAQWKRDVVDPEIGPCTYDVTISGWLARIGQWGKITIYHKNPENFWGKRKVTQKQFQDAISNEELNRILGQWEVGRKGISAKKISMFRDYLDIKGKSRREEFIISVKLKKELR